MTGSSETELIVGKVARILTSRELVINRGESHGVSVGMYFAVYDQDAEDVQDPETGEILGRVLRPKVKVKVRRVADRFAVAETYESTTVNVGGSGAGLSALGDLMSPPKYVTRVENLRTEESTWEKLDESESFVKTGDLVQQLTDPEIGTALQEFSGDQRE